MSVQVRGYPIPWLKLCRPPGVLGLMTAAIMLLVALSGLWHVAGQGLTERNGPEGSHPSYGDVRTATVPKTGRPGVSFAVPFHYLALPGTPFDSKRSGDSTTRADETCVEAASDGAAYACTRAEAHLWRTIPLRAYADPEAIGRHPGFGPVLRRRIEGIAGGMQTMPLPLPGPQPRRGGTEEAGVHYAMRGTDAVTGLEWAEPVGAGRERLRSWNTTLYWHSDRWQGAMDSRVTDLIACHNSPMPAPGRHRQCTHHFGMPEWGLKLAVTYPRGWLPQWREIKTRVRQLLLGLDTGPRLPGDPPQAHAIHGPGHGYGEIIQRRVVPAFARAGRAAREARRVA